ncbi:MAG: hypothetical protein ACTSR8_01310 [Promethearchaeota archaeon]
MPELTVSELIKAEFGQLILDKVLEFPMNKINIISYREVPLKIRSIIIENEREFHLIIDEKKHEIFHDCPSFLIYSKKKDKICIHLLKILLFLEEKYAISLFKKLDEYILTTEDFGSKKKSKNFLKLARNCFKCNNCVEGLSYLNKAIINQSDCGSIVENYLKTAIENSLFLEFFEFLKSGYENELDEYFKTYSGYIEEGFIKFLSGIKRYSFFNILLIIQALDIIFNIMNLSFLSNLKEKLAEMLRSENFNEKYFAYYLLMNNSIKLKKVNFEVDSLISAENLDDWKQILVDYFLAEINNFCVIDKLKLLKDQFKVFNIDKKFYHDNYKEYRNEIKELERKVHLRKFSYLKFLMEKFKVKRSKGEFLKKRNTYIIRHDSDNLKNPAYKYIICRLGFYGTENEIIKSTDLGVNYFMIRELFLDDLSSTPDILYYRKQFWGDLEDIQINPAEGISLMSKNISYKYEIEQKYSDINDIMIIEWDLANRPKQGSIVNAYGSPITIPDQNSPLYHDLKPFDLCYCKRTPVKIEGNIVKTINVITKCSFKDAINSVSKGMAFFEGFYPISLVKAVLEKNISPFEAYKIILYNSYKKFIPNYNIFVKAFRVFLFDFIKSESHYIFDELKIDPGEKANQIIILLNLTNELAGLDLPYADIIKKTMKPNLNISQFKSRFLEEIHNFIVSLLQNKKIGSTIVFDVKKMRHTPFYKYFKQILKIRKEEFESQSVRKMNDVYDISELNKTYYGKKFSQILKIGEQTRVWINKFHKISEFSRRLGLKLTIKE